MTAKSTRILKEARPLFWPWCAVVGAGALPLLRPPHPLSEISRLGFDLGIPLLATLPFGNEFQHRTLPLMLSQPVSRKEIWREKLSVAAMAVLTAALVFFLSWRASGVPMDRQSWALAAAAIIVLPASAAYWTLLTRSIIGGMVLNLGVYVFLFVLGDQVVFWGRGYSKLSDSTFISTMSAVFLAYAAIMLWLGWRRLARFQATGAAAGDDLLIAGPDVMPGAFAGWFRCRPSGVVLNLVRKELRLLRPVWLFTILAAVAWTWVTAVWLLNHRAMPTHLEMAGLIVGMGCTLLIVILAGSASLGEERSSGTHAWHLTLPAPALLQWGVKLSMALFAGFVGAWLLPILITGRFLFRVSYPHEDAYAALFKLTEVMLLTFAAFWCACATNGTVSAVVWVAPVGMVIGFAIHFAQLWAFQLMAFSERFRTSDNLRFCWWIARVTDRHRQVLIELDRPTFYALLVAGPALILALVQSYRLFRAPARDSFRTVIRNLAPLAMLVFLCGFSLTAFNDFLCSVMWEVPNLLFLTSRAIWKTLPAAAQQDPTRPLQLTLDDVIKASPQASWYHFPDTTRRWLTNARITVLPDKAHPGGFCCQETFPPGYGRPFPCSFSAIIHLADGTEITTSYDPNYRPRPSDIWRPPAYVRWPGAAGQEALWGE